MEIDDLFSENFSLREFVIYWDNKFPLDYWWRRKFNIPFNSSQHREMDFIDFKFNFIEEKLMKSSFEQMAKQKEDLEDYILTGNFLKNQQSLNLTKEEEIAAFDNIDLDKLYPQAKKENEEINNK